ncbi:polymorphic toxin-type HINT domain-containing protein [Streptomyces sp. NPDC056470]|uniref:polymorphic toxin-type HINT domain-containing protein n=1 Tax=Streptomyces sp. NPDC056470 TaxID=3345831 RepID=UPI0036BB8403
MQLWWYGADFKDIEYFRDNYCRFLKCNTGGRAAVKAALNGAGIVETPFSDPIKSIVASSVQAAAGARAMVGAGTRVASRLSSCFGNSFTAGTVILMADGTTKPIEEVKTGDSILATDPETGETSTETVTAEIAGQGTKNLVRVTVDTDGSAGDQTATVTATDGHPFWVPELGEWVEAAGLTVGEWLQTSAGTYVQITAIQRWTAAVSVYNLTVTDAHTYYVLAGKTPVLVHNSNCPNWAANSVKTWGHTFKTHGAGAKKTKALTDRARSTGNQQGQWLDNDAAAEFLKGVHVEGAGPRSVRIPDGLGQVIMPDGSIVRARSATIVPSPNGLYKTGFPIIGPN